MIKSCSPCRISLCGGGTDISPYPEESMSGGVVISATINKYAYANVLPVLSEIVSIKNPVLSDHKLINSVLRATNVKCGVEIETYSDVAPNSGLGNSAAISVALVGALNKMDDRELTKSEISELAYMAETKYLKNFGGRQDQYASAYGGLNID